MDEAQVKNNAQVADAIETSWKLVRSALADAVEKGLVSGKDAFAKMTNLSNAVQGLDAVMSDVVRQTREVK